LSSGLANLLKHEIGGGNEGTRIAKPHELRASFKARDGGIQLQL